MKRLSCALLLIIIASLLTGCFNLYEDTSKKKMELIDVKVYNSQGEEIIGEYKNYYSDLYDLNSAAPVLNYYVIKAKDNEAYKVEFIFNSKKNYELTKVVFTNSDSRYSDKLIECTDIKKVDKNYVATILIDKVEESNHMYMAAFWYSDDIKYSFGEKGSNTYIMGVYFLLDKEKQDM